MALSFNKKKKEIYSDFPKDLSKSPINDDLTRITNENAIKESIKNLLLTDRGERLFQPNIGSDIRKILFENMTPDVLVILKDYIETTLENYEPRCSVLDVKVSGEDHQVFVQIIFAVINNENPVTLDLTLDRVR
jgi:phage baseplate assembly protein W